MKLPARRNLSPELTGSSLRRASWRRGQHITLQEARRLALQILAETEQRRETERVMEARFSFDVSEDEDLGYP